MSKIDNNLFSQPTRINQPESKPARASLQNSGGRQLRTGDSVVGTSPAAAGSRVGDSSLNTGALSPSGQDSQLIGHLFSLLSQLLPQLQPAISQAEQNLGLPSSSAAGTAGASPGDTGAAAGPSAASATSTDDTGDTGDTGASASASGGDTDDITAANTSAGAGPSGAASSDLNTVLAQLISAINQLTGTLSANSTNSSGNGTSTNTNANNSSSSSANASANANANNSSSSSSGAGNTSATSSSNGGGAANQTTAGAAGGSPSAASGNPSSVSGGSQGLAANKQAVYKAAQQAGATPEQTATILAIGQLETNDLDPSQRDTSKDGTASANYSAFNINRDLAEKLGWNPATGPDLNDPANLPYVVGLVTKGLNQFGTDGFLAYLRGGSTGFANPGASNVQDYIQSIHKAAATQLANPELLTSSTRVASFVAHI